MNGALDAATRKCMDAFISLLEKNAVVLTDDKGRASLYVEIYSRLEEMYLDYDPSDIYRGTFDGGCPWRLTSKEELIIGAKGTIFEIGPDLAECENMISPLKERVKKIIVPAPTYFSGSMAYFFSGYPKLTRVDLKHASFSGVEIFSGMFSDCPKLKHVTINGYDFSLATDMSYMFAGCHQLQEVDFLRLTAPRLRNMSKAFAGCEKLSWPKGFTGTSFASGVNLDSLFGGGELERHLETVPQRNGIISIAFKEDSL